MAVYYSGDSTSFVFFFKPNKMVTLTAVSKNNFIHVNSCKHASVIFFEIYLFLISSFLGIHSIVIHIAEITILLESNLR